MAAKKSKVKIKDVSMAGKPKRINPRGASVLIAMPKGKKKVALYGLI